MKRKQPIKSETLWLATVGFLALPIGIFAIGWLSPVWAVPVILCLAAGLFFMPQTKEESPVTIPLWSLFLLALGCIGICVFAGVGGFTYQDGDYFKHNAILTDLYRREWPVAYAIDHGGTVHPAALVYYIAYYLPPALVGKIAGWEAMRYSMILWTSGGMFLMCLWCLKFSHGVLWAPIAFLAFGGLDVFGMFLGIKVWSWMPELWIEHRQLEWWAGFSFGNYQGHSNHLFWAPQHALPGWLIAAAVLQRIRSGTLDGCLFLVSLAPLWSPLVGLGLLPIGLAGLLVTRGKGAISYSNLAALPLLAVSALYFAARGMPEISFPPVPFGWNDRVSQKLVVTFALEVLPWTLLLFYASHARKGEQGDRAFVLVCAAFLAVLPLWRVGTFNDLMMKSSLSAFTVFSLLLLHKLTGATPRWKKVALAVWILGSGGLVIDLYRHIEFSGSRAKQISLSTPSEVPILPATPDLIGLLNQYLGSTQATFFTKLARPLTPAADPVAYDQDVPPPGAIESQDRMQKNLRRRFERGDRTQDFLRQYSTLSYYQGDLWESMLALETMIKLYPDDPNARLNLATLLASSGIEAYRERALAELDAARSLAQDPARFDRATDALRKSLQPGS